jgi:tRNA (cmo5U34)-methyltransferase
VAIDITEDMLLAYKQKLAKYTGKYELQLKDFKSEEIGNKYNIILAGLTLHHLDLNERKLYYKKLYNSLTSNGMILSRDIIIDEDNLVKQEQYQIWKKFMNLKGENAESWYQKHLIKDNPPTLSQIISWHKDAGFKDAGCYWRYCNFAIIMARKENE